MVAVEWHGYLHECLCPRTRSHARPLPRVQTVATPRMLVIILMRARPRLSDYEISRKIEEKRSYTNTFDVSKSPSCACACVFDKAQGPGQDCSSQHEVRNDVQGRPRVFRGQFKCAESSEGVQGPTMVRRSQGEQQCAES